MFDQLTTTELHELMAAIMSPEHGFGSNRMCRVLVGTSDRDLSRAYNDLANEIVHLHGEIANVLINIYRSRGIAA